VSDIEVIKERLENIRGVEPIITALRTIAAGGWRQADARLEATRLFRDHLGAALGAVAQHVSIANLERCRVVSRATLERPVMLVMASDRGLCGGFNDTVLEGAERLINQQQIRSGQVHVATLGRRAATYFRAKDRPILFEESLPVTRVVSMAFTRALGDRLLDLYENGTIDGIYAIYSPYRAGVTLPPVSRLWMPIEASSLPGSSGEWPVPIIEGDSDALFDRLIQDWSTVSLFGYVMESVASEQSARYRAMDNASTNLNKLIGELTLAYHSARQYEITMEILDLVSGSSVSSESTEDEDLW